MLNISFKKILIIALCAALAVSSVYIFNFHDHKFSESPENWGQLGDYIGGMLNPTLSFITILILISTIDIQREQLKYSKEELHLSREELGRTAQAATKQAEHFEREAKLKEYLALIDKLTTRINKNFNENRLDGERSMHTFIGHHYSGTGKLYIDAIKTNFNRTGSATQKTIDWINSDLLRLATLIKRYREISSPEITNKEEISPIPQFYQDEFRDLVECMFNYSMSNYELKQFYAP